jgi:hypothetical protein
MSPAATASGATVVVVVVGETVVVVAGTSVVGEAVVDDTVVVEVVVGNGMPFVAVSPLLQAVATNTSPMSAHSIRIFALPPVVASTTPPSTVAACRARAIGPEPVESINHETSSLPARFTRWAVGICLIRPFERAHDNPGVPAPVGLGLTVSRQLARAMGGDLRYEYEERSVLRVTLPAADGPAAVDPPVAAA